MLCLSYAKKYARVSALHCFLFTTNFFYNHKNLLQLHQFCHGKRATTENKNLFITILKFHICNYRHININT